MVLLQVRLELCLTIAQVNLAEMDKAAIDKVLYATYRLEPHGQTAVVLLHWS